MYSTPILIHNLLILNSRSSPSWQLPYSAMGLSAHGAGLGFSLKRTTAPKSLGSADNNVAHPHQNVFASLKDLLPTTVSSHTGASMCLTPLKLHKAKFQTKPRYILSQEAVRCRRGSIARKEKGPKDRCDSCEKKREGLKDEDEQDKSLGKVNGI
jgi:hypothetical protein